MKAALGLLAPVALILSAGSALAQSAERGERTFNQQCKACHTVEKGGASPIGPNLFGVVGRKAGTLEGYSYSEAMKKSGITWDDAALEDYLKDPKAKVPQGKMAFAGLRQVAALGDVVAYLNKLAP
jgi:cytochrome c